MTESAIAELALAIRTLAALVFLTAAYGKLRHLTAFQGVVANYRLLPDGLVSFAAYLLAPVEALLGAALIVEPRSPWPPALAAALLLLFALAMGVNVARGRRQIDCGCFQSALKQTLSWTLVIRNVLLCLLLVVAALFSTAVSNDAFAIINGVLAGSVLFLILQGLTLLWSLVPDWRLDVERRGGAAP
jgi:hypothetical protein